MYQAKQLEVTATHLGSCCSPLLSSQTHRQGDKTHWFPTSLNFTRPTSCRLSASAQLNSAFNLRTPRSAMSARSGSRAAFTSDSLAQQCDWHTAVGTRARARDREGEQWQRAHSPLDRRERTARQPWNQIISGGETTIVADVTAATTNTMELLQRASK